MKLFTVDNPKTLKSRSKGFYQIILHLAPHKLSGYNTCSHSTESCRKLCLFSSGMGGMLPKVELSRINKTKNFFENNENFLKQLKAEIAYYEQVASNEGLKLLVRLNGTSDLNWYKYKLENKTFFEYFPHIQFVDYTKNLNLRSLFPNHKIVYSVQRDTLLKGYKLLKEGHSIAGVFTEVPKEFEGYAIEPGDEDDVISRHNNKFIGLRYKKITIKGTNNKEIIKNNQLILQ